MKDWDPQVPEAAGRLTTIKPDRLCANHSGAAVGASWHQCPMCPAKDARHLGVVQSPGHGPMCIIPPDDPLWSILQRAADHSDEFPTHGGNCACMDDFVRQVRASIVRAVGERPYSAWTNTDEWNRAYSRRIRVQAVLHYAMKVL